MAVNHLGHALLMNLLAPIMNKTASEFPNNGPPRIVSLSSAGHRFVPSQGIEFDELRNAITKESPVIMYCEAKLAQLLYARSFSLRHPQIMSLSVNPGDIRTNLYTDTKGPWFFPLVKAFFLPLFAYTIEDGAKKHFMGCHIK